ncbi:hypothetical protein GGR57DRAFT_382441 [Xylariaceae sp. FL1272]|nr:hypothetical protein GGR57DRAFT_382441 [Xylariaceae sp. FL1272]
MFSTFTGSSRRPRNVDLSGQRNKNTWASTPGAPNQSGASKTVAQAQAERERRQREREELAATKRLQKIWRGHRDRRRVKDLRRQEYDALYQEHPVPEDIRHRLTSVFPLLLAVFTPGRSDDQQRLDLFVSDLRALYPTLTPSVDVRIFTSAQWDRLARLLVAAFKERTMGSAFELLTLAVDIIKYRPACVKPVLDSYYTALTRLYQDPGLGSSSQKQGNMLAQAVAAPLASSFDREPDTLAYQSLAFSFLTSSHLEFFQRAPSCIAQSLDLPVLSRSIIDAFTNSQLPASVSKDDLLWLLAHFITLNKADSNAQGSQYLEALYLQMGYLAEEIRSRSRSSREADESDLEDDIEMLDFSPLPAYVALQLNFLVNEDGIANLLLGFSLTAASASHLSQSASLLAGYTLGLLQCFPTHGDDIKMRLFQGDIRVSSGDTRDIPLVKYFWNAASKTQVFKSIAQQARPQENPVSIAALVQPDPIRDLEWRTVLLFLELYNFLLRVTDDEDFLPRETQIAAQQSQATQRIRSSGLKPDELKQLVNFLKNLTFPFHYNLAQILNPTHASVRLDAIMSGHTTRPAPRINNGSLPSFAGIGGMDVLGLRELASSVTRALYERDSRRPFLPKDYWLMTSKFDMNVFVSAIVLEEARNIDEEEEGEDVDLEEGPSTSHISEDWLSRSTDRRRGQTGHALDFRNQVGPKLEVLRNMPFVIPFELRVQIFRQFVYLDKTKRRGGLVDPDQWRLAIMSRHMDAGGNLRRDVLTRHTARISRGKEFDDAFDQFYTLGDGLKEPIQITFVDQFDTPEAGIDGGGVTKEFLTNVTNDAFNPQREFDESYFVSNEQNLLYPNPTIFDDVSAKLQSEGFSVGSVERREAMKDLMKRYEFLGRIVGKCLYEGILIDISFASFFLLKWSSSGQDGSGTDNRANVNDLRDLDPELYQGLMSLKNFSGDVADLSLDFTVTDSVWHPSGQRRTVTRPLREGGAEIPVTNKDRPLYIFYVAHHRLVAQQKRQTAAFLRGLGTIVNPAWLAMFNQSELQRLIGGDSQEIDIEDLRRNTAYSGIYQIGDDGQEHPTIKHFWDVMRSMPDEERRMVLKYVTSTPRAPLLGFQGLVPKFSIRDGGNDEKRLPSASTCINLLKLPVYKSSSNLRSKLLYAVKAGAGFDLS